MIRKEPVILVEFTDPVTGAKGWTAILELINGMSAGGLRMWKGVTKEEVIRLGQTMTVKNAVLDIPIGGAKSGIDFDPTSPDAPGVMERFLTAIKPLWTTCYQTGEDLGTNEDDIIAVAKKLGMKSPVDAFLLNFNKDQTTLDNMYKGLAIEVDGLNISEIATGYGCYRTTIEALTYMKKDPKQCTVAVQGFGSVGGGAAKYLDQAGVKVVAVADVQGTIYSEEGLDVPMLLKNRSKGVINREVLPKNYQLLPKEDIIGLPVTVLIPAASADVITAANADQVKASLIVEGANIPTTAEAQDILYKRGVTIIIDFVANAGGMGFYGLLLMGLVEPDIDQVFKAFDDKFHNMVCEVLETAAAQKSSAPEAAWLIVNKKLEAYGDMLF